MDLSDWSGIQAITGDDSWAPSKMRKYYQRLEKARYLPNSVVGHGFSGWLETSLTDLTLIAQDLKVISLVLAAATGMGKSLLSGLLTTVTGLGQVLLRDINNAYLASLQTTFPPHRLGPLGDVAKVNCTTCHQGAYQPLLGASMVKTYPELTEVTASHAVVERTPTGPEELGRDPRCPQAAFHVQGTPLHGHVAGAPVDQDAVASTLGVLGVNGRGFRGHGQRSCSDPATRTPSSV